MRPANWFRLLVVCLLAGGARTPSALALHPPDPNSNQVVIKHEFQGFGLTPKDAETHALENACKWLADNSGLGWTPTPEFLRAKGMVQFGEPAEREFAVAKEFGGQMQVVSMRLEVTPSQARDIQKQARQQRTTSRQPLAARVLGGVVCLLLVVGGYLRLEEATKGYYTRLLRVAALAILIVVGLGLCAIA